mgnify:CR=1 FL=1
MHKVGMPTTCSRQLILMEKQLLPSKNVKQWWHSWTQRIQVISHPNTSLSSPVTTAWFRHSETSRSTLILFFIVFMKQLSRLWIKVNNNFLPIFITISKDKTKRGMTHWATDICPTNYLKFVVSKIKRCSLKLTWNWWFLFSKIKKHQRMKFANLSQK